MNRNFRILVLCPDIPYPIIAGGHMRMASLIPALVKTGTVHVVFNRGEKTVSNETIAWFKRLGVTWHAFSRKKRSRVMELAHKVCMLVRMDNLYHYGDEQKEITGQIGRYKPDCIWLETPYQCRYVMHIRNSVPVVVDYWGLLSEGSYRDYLHAPKNKKTAKWCYWKIATIAERNYAKAFPFAVTVSTPVSAYIRKSAPAVTVATIPNGIIKQSAVTVEKYSGIRPSVDFIMSGDFSFAPNIDAALYFVDEVLPLIRKSHHDATLCCTGKDPVSEIRRLAGDPGITVTGFVNDLLGEIAKGRVYVLPLRMGSGIRSKLFDVFPLGKPIVTTSTGAEGLDLVDGENCFIVDGVQMFAERCVSLLNDEGLCGRLGEAAKKLAFETYSQQSIEQKIADTITMVRNGVANE